MRIYTLPARYRPAARTLIPVDVARGWYLTVNPDGSVTCSEAMEPTMAAAGPEHGPVAENLLIASGVIPPVQPELVSWEPRWTAPLIRSACPSCGAVGTRPSGAWNQRQQDDGRMTLHARMACDQLGCHRTWDETVDAPREQTNPELWR